MSNAFARARLLKTLNWGSPDGLTSYEELPPELRSVAMAADALGDHLAANRVMFFDGLDSQSHAITQVHVIAYSLVEQVVPLDGATLPDESVVWTKRDLDGGRFDSDALDAALAFYSLHGEPNVFRVSASRAGRPALSDVRAMQLLAREIVETAEGMEEVGITPTSLLEDFARSNWSNREGSRGLMSEWELHPLGASVITAVRAAAARYPAEEAEAPGWLRDLCDRDVDGDAVNQFGIGNPWEPPNDAGPHLPPGERPRPRTA